MRAVVHSAHLIDQHGALRAGGVGHALLHHVAGRAEEGQFVSRQRLLGSPSTPEQTCQASGKDAAFGREAVQRETEQRSKRFEREFG